MSNKKKGSKRTIQVDYLARVEGEGGLFVTVDKGVVSEVQLRIFEPPRFFEALLRGRSYKEAPDITARICGICPVAYQMSACHAMEQACGVKVEGGIRQLRRLLYCGEWIESHTLHIYMLHAPDFLNYDGAIEMAKDHPDLVNRGLRLKKTGNEILRVLGGREIHPINVKLGGFYRTPTKKELRGLREKLLEARALAQETVKWCATFTFPEAKMKYEFVSLSHPDEYPMNEGTIVSDRGLNISIDQYDNHFSEQHVAYSTALHSKTAEGSSYFVGPMARYNLNFQKLAPFARELAKEIGFSEFCDNPFKSIVVRSLEVLHACDEAISIIEKYEEPAAPAVDVPPKDAVGFGCTEAPRGLLYHCYRITKEGEIAEAKIVPPTSQNQSTIEDDIRQVVTSHIDSDDDRLQHICEQTIRNYDPCISCSTHFLKLHINRNG